MATGPTVFQLYPMARPLPCCRNWSLLNPLPLPMSILLPIRAADGAAFFAVKDCTPTLCDAKDFDCVPAKPLPPGLPDAAEVGQIPFRDGIQGEARLERCLQNTVGKPITVYTRRPQGNRRFGALFSHCSKRSAGVRYAGSRTPGNCGRAPPRSRSIPSRALPGSAAARPANGRCRPPASRPRPPAWCR